MLIDLIGHGAGIGAVVTGFAIVMKMAFEQAKVAFGGEDDDEE